MTVLTVFGHGWNCENDIFANIKTAFLAVFNLKGTLCPKMIIMCHKINVYVPKVTYDLIVLVEFWMNPVIPLIFSSLNWYLYLNIKSTKTWSYDIWMYLEKKKQKNKRNPEPLFILEAWDQDDITNYISALNTAVFPILLKYKQK